MINARPWLAAPLLALAIAGCGDDSKPPNTTPDAGHDSGAPPVDPTTFGVSDAGPYTCGHRTLMTTYTPPDGQPARTIPVHVWYPSTTTDGTHTTYRGVFQDKVAWEDGDLAPPAWKDGYPVLLHSHGYQGWAGNSARLMCHFAAHGWLAVAPEHVGNTTFDTVEPLALALYYERPLDMKAALDLVSNLPKDDPLAGKADLGHLGVSGHSFGSYTAWVEGGATFDPANIQKKCDAGDPAMCDAAGVAVFSTDLSEHRAKVIIPMAEGHNDFFTSTGENSARVPVVLMSGSLNPVGDDTLFANASGIDITWADVEGGCHQLYGWGNTFFGDTSCTVLPDEEGFGIVNPFILAVARYHVLGERGDEVVGLAQGTKGLSAKMTYHHKGP